MRLRYLLLAITAAALLPVVAGCGGSSEQAVAQTTMPLKKYVNESDLICGDGSIEQGKLAGVYLETHPKAEELDMVIPAMVPPIEKEITELQELGLPRGHEEEAELVLEEMEAALEELKANPRSLSQKNNPFEKSDELAAKLGLGDCSKNP